uniref:Basic tail secreted protein n=1 Tax=Rhipicephalus zambeziensis TaxID=60191 RepID=A0A224Y1N8_9ACAR
MKLVGLIALLLLVLTENIVDTQYSVEPPPMVYSSTVYQAPKSFCYYLYWDGWRLRSAYYEDGTPCWYFHWGRKVGQCFHGKCARQPVKPQIPCDGIHHAPGYATSCMYTCTIGNQNIDMPYKNQTPCLPVDESGRRVGGAGICVGGNCKPSYDLTSEEEKVAHPEDLRQCPDKEHTGRNILTSCYYYCQRNGSWYTGHYDSQPTSGCDLRNPTPQQPLGWCCQGDCIKKHNCGR